MSQRRTLIGMFTCEPLPNSMRLKLAVTPGRARPRATPTTMQARTHAERYRSKKARRLGGWGGFTAGFALTP